MQLRIITYNVNGIRAAIKKGFADWLKSDPADIICLQETKATKESVDNSLFSELGYSDFWFSAQKKGYSGVTFLSKVKPDNIIYGNGNQVSDDEGRIIQMQLGDLRLINAYFPSGTTGGIRQEFKYKWLDDFQQYLNNLKKENPKIIVCGDYNIAHKEIDIHNPKGNAKTSGFLPEERAWMDKFFESGYTDSFRHFNKEPHHYTWWSQRFPSVRLENKGWRLDYINVTNPLVPALKSAAIYSDVKHSDHCPVFLELDI